MDSERLLHTARDDWQRSLIEAAASEVAPEGVQAQMLRALESFGDPASAAASTLNPKLAALEGWGATKLAVLVVAVVGAGLSAYWLATRATPPAPASLVRLKAAELSSVAARPPQTTVPPPSETADDAPAEARARARLGAPPPAPKAKVAQRKPAASNAGDALSRELRLLTAARSQLHSGDAAASLDTLERYQRAFPSGILRPEAEQLRLRAHELTANPK